MRNHGATGNSASNRKQCYACGGNAKDYSRFGRAVSISSSELVGGRNASEINIEKKRYRATNTTNACITSKHKKPNTNKTNHGQQQNMDIAAHPSQQSNQHPNQHANTPHHTPHTNNTPHTTHDHKPGHTRVQVVRNRHKGRIIDIGYPEQQFLAANNNV